MTTTGGAIERGRTATVTAATAAATMTRRNDPLSTSIIDVDRRVHPAPA